MSSLSCAPVHPVSIVRTAVALDFHMPSNRDLAMSQEVYRIGVGGRRGERQASAYVMPVASESPCGRFLRMSPACPVAERDPGEMVESFVHGLTHTCAVIESPAPNLGVELVDQLALRQGVAACNDPTKRREMIRHIGLCGFDQGFVA
jgi:hypothetical protein